MAHHLSVFTNTQLLNTILLLMTTSLQIYAYPYPYPYAQPFAQPAVHPSSTNRNQYEQIFDKTQFKPPELEETIEEVQKILQKDPSLPRLTRGEIEELYERVTREEYQKSIEAGDLGRADSMRALMLVLPYNTDNSTSDHLQDLYTRPPVTKVIDGYTQHPPIKFITPNSSARTEIYASGQLAATTYKPGLPLNVAVSPTTYHPPPPAPVFNQQQTTLSLPETQYDFQPILNDAASPAKTVQRYSSHYNAKDTDFLKVNAQRKRKVSQTSTIRPVADILESLGIVGQTQSRKRFTTDDYYTAESAPRPVISGYIPLNGDFDGLRGQSVAPKITSDAYSSFKPLNIGEEIRVKPEVEDYLTRFGIVGGRKRKALKKTQNTRVDMSEEQTSAGTEINTASVPESNSRGNTNTELEKLLENLQELERLSGNKKKSILLSTASPSTTPLPTTTEATSLGTTPSLITNGVPMLIEPKKPRRRIDPHFDLNFGASGNQQLISPNDDQLAKLLDNLQELEKLRLNPENVLKKVAPTLRATKPIQTTTSTTTSTTTTTTPATIILSSGAQNEQLELQRLFKQLQSYEQSSVKTTTTKKPNNIRQNGGAPFDLLQLRKLLTDDNELERLYERARSRVAPSTTPKTTTAKTTQKPQKNDLEFEQLQRYLAELDKARTTTTTSTTTTTTTTPRPVATTHPTKKSSTDDAKIQELINRVQQLERLNSDKPKSTTESTTYPYLGFTSRNVKAPTKSAKSTADDYRIPSNDFAQLQQLYKEVQDADRASFAHVEISTAATASKQKQKGEQTEDFAQRIIDSTNDTGSETNLQDVDPNDFVQLQKLLSKVQELERVRINSNGVVEKPASIPKRKLPTHTPSLVTAASIQSPNVQRPTAQIVYPENSHKYIQSSGVIDDFKQQFSTSKPSSVSKKSGVEFPGVGSSEELRELAYSRPINPKQSAIDQDFEKYQEFFTSLEDAGERQSYKTFYDNMEPPVIKKTVPTKVTKYFPTQKSQDLSKSTTLSNQQKTDLNELQKLLSNAQALEKLGVTLPKSLSDQIESKLAKTTEIPTSPKPTKPLPKEPEVNIYLDRYGLKPKPTKPTNKKFAVISLTTAKPQIPKSEKPNTDSPMELPVFSATKIIEAAIKQAANRIGVTKETPQGFRRRSDSDIDDIDVEYGADDMMGEFSEMNYQIAIPDINRMREDVYKSKSGKAMDVTKTADITENADELQRLIGNLQELQKLNISISSDMLKLADKTYLDSLKPQQTTADETSKSRRQSATAAILITNAGTIETSSTAAPTYISLNADLDDSDTNDATKSITPTASTESTKNTTSETTTTEEPRNGSLADLEASFGPDPNKVEPLPPKKKNGFYFLADWNSFLEVGENEDQVIVRFNPQIGDPRQFVDVKP